MYSADFCPLAFCFKRLKQRKQTLAGARTWPPRMSLIHAVRRRVAQLFVRRLTATGIAVGGISRHKWARRCALLCETQCASAESFMHSVERALRDVRAQLPIFLCCEWGVHVLTMFHVRQCIGQAQALR